MKVEEVEIDDLTTLANFFIDNKNNQFVVESSDFKNTRDLYFFCVEITTKILSIKYGDVNGTVNIDQLSIEEIKVVQDLLLNAAIHMEIDIKEIDYNEERTNIIYNIPVNDLEKSNIQLDDYSTSIQKNNKQYDIKYKIV
tara:strand:- start:1770 stop:2189 length:420 start_codon:yes stop_codon:yes gene_type:complete